MHARAQLTYGNVTELEKRCEAKLDKCCAIHAGRAHLCSAEKHTHTLVSRNLLASFVS